MSKVLAAIDNSATAAPVLSAAAAVAAVLGVDVEAVHARENGYHAARAAADSAGVPLRETRTHGLRGLIEAADDPAVDCVVLGARSSPASRRPAGHIALELARSLNKPLVVVPPDGPMPVTFERILVPLDGTRETADALAATVGLACEREIEVIALHVHEYADLPLFSDQPHHEADAWSREFLRRYSTHPELVTLETRVGVPGAHVLGFVREGAVDMVALGWSQHLEHGRAAVVRFLLAESPIPLLLVPIGTRGAHRSNSPSRAVGDRA
jgi:nucleotide-binding universal stress UspA family protein